MSKKQEAFWGYIVCIVVAIGLAAALASWWSSDDIVQVAKSCEVTA